MEYSTTNGFPTTKIIFDATGIFESIIMSNIPETNATSSNFVQSHSVTSQFNALSVDREKFRNAKLAAQASCEQVQKTVRELKQEQSSLLTLMRTEQEILGNLTRKHDMIGTEKTRLWRVLDCERKALETCAKHFRTLTEDADLATLKYANDMDEACSEVAGYLQREVNHGIMSLLSVDSVQTVVAPKLPNDVRIRQAFLEAFELLQDGEQALEDQLVRHAMLSKLQSSAPDNNHDTENQMDLFYGVGDSANAP